MKTILIGVDPFFPLNGCIVLHIEFKVANRYVVVGLQIEDLPKLVNTILKYLLGSTVVSSTVIKSCVGSIMRIIWFSRK